MLDYLKSEEKKVEFIELIYDLIFVYMIGRNNSLVTHLYHGFIEPSTYLTYLLCTLITIQIWYMTTLFINRYGSNDFSEYVGLFINMYLLYYMAEGTRVYWESYYYRYNIAWALILINITVQYYIKMKKPEYSTPWERTNIKFFMKMTLIMVAIIIAGIILYHITGLPLTPAAMVVGMILSVTQRKKLDLVAVDFSHLTERVMLYVVFTFGEMIISISGYFGGEVNLFRIYLSTCAFLIVVGLFMSYGFLYDHLLDREMSISGNGFMIIHIFIIFALSNITMSLEFMPEEAIALIPKTIYLVVSFLVYYIFIFLLVPYTKGFNGRYLCFKWFGLTLIIFAVLTLLLYKRAEISIAITVAMTFIMWHLEYRYWKYTVQSEAE